MFPRHSCGFRLLNILCPSHIFRIFSGQCKLCKSQRIRTVGRSLPGRDQFVRRRHRIMNLRHHTQHQILRQCTHLRPVLDIRSKLDLHGFVRHAFGIKYSVGINIAVKMIFIFSDLSVKVRRRRQNAFIRRRSRDGTGIHQRHRRDLAALQLGALPVREVSRGVTDTERIVCRRIARAEAGPAECRFHHSAGLQNIRCLPVSDQFHINGHGCRIYAERKALRSDIAAL